MILFTYYQGKAKETPLSVAEETLARSLLVVVFLSFGWGFVLYFF